MKILKDIKDYHIIKKSGMFDVIWFKNKYNLADDIDPIKYYLEYGIEKGLNPCNDFNTLWYLKEYVDVKNSGMHPFVHYIRHGIKEHRLPKPLFIEITDKFSLENQDYNPCFLKNKLINLNKNEVNVAIFIKNDLENLLPTEYIRLVIPFYHLFLQKSFKPYVFHNDDFNILSEDNFRNFDVIIVQRDAIGEKVAKFLVESCKNNDTKLIYEIDDDLLGIEKNHPNYDEFIGKKEVIEYLISNSDIVTVSTNNLKEKLHHLNSNVRVIKNSLNDMLNLENDALNSNIIKIGYMGTLTHKNDVKLIEKAIDNVKKHFSKERKKIIFETVGVSDEKIDCSDPVNIPFKYSKYPCFIRWLKKIVNWDIALAPLENSEINKSKSEIKYLEYTSLGVPGIYSNIGSYGEVIENNKNGILIENNTVEEWQIALIQLIDDIELRKNIVENARKDIKYNYSIELMVNSWSNIFEDILTKEKLAKFNENSLKLLVNPLFKEDYNYVIESGLFNKYEYPIVAQDEIYHFLIKGIFEGYNPSYEFNCKNYAELNNININIINPFVHFIKNHVYKFKFNFLAAKNIEDIYQNLEKKVSVIVPIYNAYEDTKKCIESILKYSTKNYELILINDKSTDSRVGTLLKSYENNQNIIIINNPVNVGFVTSVNIGLKYSNHDVILLNSDTIVTPKWIEKLTCAAYSDKNIATVTPFSNNAGVFSVPVMNKNNTIPEKLSLNEMSNIIEKLSNHKYMRIPTGNGFCMYIKRDVINSIGYFDDKTFGRGYGEENDFCMRAIYNGWENIIDDSTYIFHKGSSSFGYEKQKLINQHMEILEDKHPTYKNEVNKFVRDLKIQNVGSDINYALQKDLFKKKRVLYISDLKDNSLINDENENYLLHIDKLLNLYYDCGDLFKIKEWASDNIDELIFYIIINLGIDECHILNGEFYLEKSKYLLNFVD